MNMTSQPTLCERYQVFLDNHIPDLQDRPPKDVAKMVKQIVKDPECKYLRPTERTTESLDEDFPMQF